MSKESKKALLINEGLSNNFGDQAIKHSMVSLLNKNKYNIVFEDLTRNTETVDNSYFKENKEAKRKTAITPFKSVIGNVLWLLKNLKRIISTSKTKYDVVIIGGGQLLLPNGIFPFVIYTWISILKIMGNRNLVIFGVGLQGQYDTISKIFITHILKSVKSIHVRDNLSIKILKEVFNTDANFTYDVAFMFNPKNEQKAQEIINEYKFLIGIVDYNVFKRYNTDELGNYKTNEEYFESWITKIGGIENLKESRLIYATREDRNECIKFQNYLKIKYELHIKILENVNLNAFMTNLTRGTRVISGRMHTLILALVCKKTIIDYPISQKLENFCQLYNNGTDINHIKNLIQSEFIKALYS